MTNRYHPRRSAFTLIELLVVIVLIMILAGLAAAFLPNIGDAARQARGATMLQQWILTAKQRALRDQVPIGIKLVPYKDPATGIVTPGQVRQCQYIEQPDDFAVTPASTVGNMSGTAGNNFVTIDMQLSDQVGPGDYLEILGNGLMHGISGVGPAHSQPRSTQITLTSPLLYSFNPTKQYRIVRAPRVTGDDILQLPEQVLIDLTTNRLFSNTLPTPNADGSIDILFSPSGAVISPGTTTDSINLWVRDATYASASTTDGEQAIVAVYVRSGLIATHPPAPGIDPYAFVKDGRSSGK